MWATLIWRNWRAVLLAMVTACLMVTWTLYQGAKNATQACRIEYRAASEAAQAQRAEVELRSKKTVERINGNHQKKLDEAILNARSHWAFTCRLPSQSHVAADATFADSPRPPDGAPSEPMADPVAQLVDHCASATNQVIEWQEWARLNHLPIEGE
jgi:hypothetical protein